MEKEKIIHAIILSTKSAGSSALLSCLQSDFHFRKIEQTRHFENETLFWTKAASILNAPQNAMHRSVVPYPAKKARESLREFLLANGVKPGNLETKSDIFQAYSALIDRYKPKFAEKSPHHLFNASNLDLLKEFVLVSTDEVEFKIIGLVRHPLSVIYSGWQRWKYDCDSFEREWLASYTNLLRYRNDLGIQVVRYEDLVLKGASVEELLNIKALQKNFLFKETSLNKWKLDRIFAHKLRADTKTLARQLGYEDFETSGNIILWYLVSQTYKISFMLKGLWRKIYKRSRQKNSKGDSTSD